MISFSGYTFAINVTFEDNDLFFSLNLFFQDLNFCFIHDTIIQFACHQIGNKIVRQRPQPILFICLCRKN